MIKSMTGFGRSEIASGNRKIMVEMKSVNHRFLETGIKMPKKLNVFEARIRDVVKKYASRGKIDIFITYEDNSENNVNIRYNPAVAEEYMDIFSQMEEMFSIRNDVAFCALSTSLSLTPVITALRSVFNVLASDNILFASVPSLNISSPIIIIGTKAIAIFLAILSFLFRLLLSIPEFILISILTLLRFQGCVTHVSCKKPYILLFYLAIKHIYEQHYKPGYVQPSSG